MKNWLKKFRKKQAQAILELAIFGAVFLFLLGALVNKSMAVSYQQNAQLRAMRIALALSYYTTHAPLRMSNASRNTASVVFIEDRLAAGAGKYGNFDRVPIVAVSGGGTLSKNLYMPVDFNDREDLARQDLYINGKAVTLTTAGFATLTVPDRMYKQVINHPLLTQKPTPSIAATGSGLVHPSSSVPSSGTCGGPMAPFGDGDFNDCLWGWKEVMAEEIDFDNSKNTVLDVDGDLQDETILEVARIANGTGNLIISSELEDFVVDDEGEYTLVSVDIIDSQLGQINSTKADHDGPPQGLINDFEMRSDHSGSLVVDGGYQPPNRSRSRDVITRQIRLNPRRQRAFDNDIGCSRINGNICFVESTIVTP